MKATFMIPGIRRSAPGIVLLLCLLAGATGCTSPKKVSKKFVYFQNNSDSVSSDVQLKEPLIKNNDLISIQVFSGGISQDQASIFNLPNGGSVSSSSGNSSSPMSAVGASSDAGGYQVGTDGNILLPVIGRVGAVGLTRNELAARITAKLDSAQLVKDPLVLIKFKAFKVNVLGEVMTPGTITFSNEKVTIIDAIARAGDLKDVGRRDNITVIRDEGGEHKSYNIDMRDKALFKSPAYQLAQNDIIYVQPNSYKLKNLKQGNSEFQRNTALIITILSAVITSISSYYFIQSQSK